MIQKTFTFDCYVKNRDRIYLQRALNQFDPGLMLSA